MIGNDSTLLKTSQINTPLGPMLAVSDEEALLLLEFTDRRNLEKKLEKLRIKTKSSITSGSTAPLISIERELQDYFNGDLKQFETPLRLIGSSFQKEVWKILEEIPYGETRSYGEQALSIGNKGAARAVANANAANPIAIVIPCHRIIQSNGKLGGYAGGVHRKQWLIKHETLEAQGHFQGGLP